MKAYIFQAALLCESCGKATCDQLRPSILALHSNFIEADEYTYDSDYFPKGPFSDGGGEADSPQHCDHCGVFLENPLTTDGDKYVREHAEPFLLQSDSTWSEAAVTARLNDHSTVAEWIEFYLAPGM